MSKEVATIEIKQRVSRGDSSSLLSGSAIAGFFRIANVMAVLLINVLVTRVLATNQVGIYYSVWGLVTFSALFGQLGLRQATVKWIADALQKSDEGRVRAAIVSSTKIAVSSFSLLSVCSLGVYFAAKLIGYVFIDSATMLFISLWLFCIGIQTALSEVFRGYARHDLAGFCGGFLANGLSLLGLFVLSLVGEMTLQQVIAVIAICSFANFCVICFMLWQLVADLPANQTMSCKSAITTSLPMMFASTSRGALEMLDIVILGFCGCLLYTSPSPRDLSTSRMPSSA